jgi:hypothetical protein
MIDSFIIGLGIGISLTPIWYLVAYIIDQLWRTFRPLNEGD